MNGKYRVSKYRLSFLFCSLLINQIHFKFTLGKIWKSTHETIIPQQWIQFYSSHFDRIICTSFIINQILLGKKLYNWPKNHYHCNKLYWNLMVQHQFCKWNEKLQQISNRENFEKFGNLLKNCYQTQCFFQIKIKSFPDNFAT